MDSIFLNIVARTLNAEGVLSDQISDHGGLTKYGITKPVLAEYRDTTENFITSNDIMTLTRDGAIDVYHKLFWLRPKLDALPPELAEEVFDFAVNSGRARAIKALQHAVGALEDGNLGPATVPMVQAACKKVGLRRFCNDYVIARGQFLMRLVEGDPSQLKFLSGWYVRVISKLDFAYL
jgi:lysozyme family protein